MNNKSKDFNYFMDLLEKNLECDKKNDKESIKFKNEDLSYNETILFTDRTEVNEIENNYLNTDFSNYNNNNTNTFNNNNVNKSISSIYDHNNSLFEIDFICEKELQKFRELQKKCIFKANKKINEILSLENKNKILKNKVDENGNNNFNNCNDYNSMNKHEGKINLNNYEIVKINNKRSEYSIESLGNMNIHFDTKDLNNNFKCTRNKNIINSYNNRDQLMKIVNNFNNIDGEMHMKNKSSIIEVEVNKPKIHESKESIIFCKNTDFEIVFAQDKLKNQHNSNTKIINPVQLKVLCENEFSLFSIKLNKNESFDIISEIETKKSKDLNISNNNKQIKKLSKIISNVTFQSYSEKEELEINNFIESFINYKT